MIFLALGFLGPEDTLSKIADVKLDPKSNFEATFGDFRTSVDGVFAAGDCRRGQSLVVWAIAEGREAAESVDRWERERDLFSETPLALFFFFFLFISNLEWTSRYISNLDEDES